MAGLHVELHRQLTITLLRTPRLEIHVRNIVAGSLGGAREPVCGGPIMLLTKRWGICCEPNSLGIDATNVGMGL